jgi:hypothetical protein
MNYESYFRRPVCSAISLALAKHTVGDGSSHAVEPVQQSAVVVILVPKVKNGQNDQGGNEDAHLIYPFAFIPKP